MAVGLIRLPETSVWAAEVLWARPLEHVLQLHEHNPLFAQAVQQNRLQRLEREHRVQHNQLQQLEHVQHVLRNQLQQLEHVQHVLRNRLQPKQERVQHSLKLLLGRRRHDKEALQLRVQEQPQLEAEVLALHLEAQARLQEVAPEVQAVDEEISRITLKKIQWKK